MPLALNKNKFSYLDYLTWPNEERWELIEGIPYAMSPAPSRIHQEISMRLTNEIYNYLKDKKCKVYVAPFDVRLCKVNVDDKDIINIVQPDITVVCNEDMLDDRGAKGVPDLIMEIVSPSSISLDYIKKLNLYGDYGVKEYWIIDPTKKTVFVYKVDENNNYGAPDVYSVNDIVNISIFESLSIKLSDIFV